VKKKCYNKGVERGFDSIKTCYALSRLNPAGYRLLLLRFDIDALHDALPRQTVDNDGITPVRPAYMNGQPTSVQ